LQELIGKGGMGQVYKAHDMEIGRDVAIKVLPPDLAEDPAYAARFRREAYTVARLNEPHIIPIYDTGEIDGRLYLAMPIINGVDLQTLLKDGAMRPELAVKVIEQVASALDTAHANNLIHRDIKPSNVLMTPSEFVYLIDFGIARDSSSDTKLTKTGSVIGTFAYMAPERFTTGASDNRSDVYALTCVLHECLTGEGAYPGNSLEQQMAGHLISEPPRPSAANPTVPPGFDDVIARGMAKDPEERYQSASELARAARAALNYDATVAPPANVPPPPPPPASPASGVTPPSTNLTPPPSNLTPPTNLTPPSNLTPPPPVAPPSTVAPVSTTSHAAPGVAEDPRTAILPDNTPLQPTVQAMTPPPATRDAPREPAKREAPKEKSNSPAIPFAIAAAVALIAVVVALVGIGSPTSGGDLPPGAVNINGIDPVSTGEITADLSKPIPILVTTPGADSVSMTVDVLGASFGQNKAPLAPGPGGGMTTLPSPVNRYVLAGQVPVKVTVNQGDNALGTYRFMLSSTQSALTTVTAVVTLILILIAAAYLETNIRVLRRGRESAASVLAAVLFAGLLGVAAVGAVWVLFANPPTVATVVVAAGLGGLAGLATAIGARRVGSRAAARRKQNRR
jgi:serine/threonine protein kinase